MQQVEAKSYFSQLATKTFDLGFGSWIGDFGDGINFLEIFSSKKNGTNTTNWESPNYMQAVADSFYSSSTDERISLLHKAEEIIMDEMPVIPVFQLNWVYMKDPHLKNAYVTKEGFLDITHASLK